MIGKDVVEGKDTDEPTVPLPWYIHSPFFFFFWKTVVAPLFWGFIFDEQWLPPCFGALFFIFYYFYYFFLPYCFLVLRLWF